MLEKLALPLAFVGLFAGSIGLVYKLGNLNGTYESNRQWAAETELREAAMNKLQGEYTILQSQHAQRVKELTHELTLADAQHEDELSRYRSDYAGRVQLAERRAEVYQRQARGSSLEQDRLAKHAAELDRSLEEGRGLVRELGEVVRQRDRTIHTLGQIILNDRTLFSGEPNGY
jgi:hypothetical protein